MRRLVAALVLMAACALPCQAQSIYPQSLDTLGAARWENTCATAHSTSVTNGTTTVVKNSAGIYCGFVVTTAIASTAFQCNDNASALSGTIMEWQPPGLGVLGSMFLLQEAFNNGFTCGAASGTGVVTVFWK